MYIVDSYSLAVIFCIITMLGWGSWANTLKMTPKKWEFPLYYWDYSIGLVLTTLLFGFTFGSSGTEGRSFVADLSQADFSALSSAFIGGIIFNLSNLLIVAATAIAGMAVAFPIAVGLALVIGVVVNYIATPLGNPYLAFYWAGIGCNCHFG
jgi:glucose uptake protein